MQSFSFNLVRSGSVLDTIHIPAYCLGDALAQAECLLIAKGVLLQESDFLEYDIENNT